MASLKISSTMYVLRYQRCECYKAPTLAKVFSKVLKLIFNPSMESIPDEWDKNKFVIGIGKLYFHYIFSHLR